jgi:hypothetical protein
MIASKNKRFQGVMSNPVLRTPFGEVELRPAQPAPGQGRAYVLLPELDELLGVPGFGLADPICVGPARAFDLRALFRACRVLH